MNAFAHTYTPRYVAVIVCKVAIVSLCLFALAMWAAS